MSVLDFFRYIPESGFSGSYGSSSFNFFSGIFILFSLVALPICKAEGLSGGVVFSEIADGE